MPKFKNLMKSIFDEDIDVDQEEMEEEKEEPKKVEEPAPQPMVVKPEAPAEPKKPVDPQPVQQSDPISLADVVLDPVPEKKATQFGSLDIQKVQKKDTSPTYKKPYHFDRSKLNQDAKPVRKKQPEYNYQSIMSPIFGNTSDDKKDYDKIHNAVELEKPVVSSALEQVISPMFGQDIPSYRKENEIPRKDPDTVGQKVNDATEAIALDDILEKTDEEKPKQEKLFASKN